SVADQKGATIGAFIQQFYDQVAFIPELILVQAMPEDWQVLEQWLSDKRHAKVELRTPQRGKKRQLMALAETNAAEYLRLQQAEWAADTNRQTSAVAELQAVLGLENPPSRIE